MTAARTTATSRPSAGSQSGVDGTERVQGRRPGLKDRRLSAGRIAQISGSATALCGLRIVAGRKDGHSGIAEKARVEVYGIDTVDLRDASPPQMDHCGDTAPGGERQILNQFLVRIDIVGASRLETVEFHRDERAG